MTFYYSTSNGKAKLIICAIGKLQILLTNIYYTAVPSTTNFIATNGLPGKDGKTKTSTVEAACINNDTLISDQTNAKRKQSSVMFDNARLAARRVTRATSSLPIHDNERHSKRPFSNTMTGIQNVRRDIEHFASYKSLFSS